MEGGLNSCAALALLARSFKSEQAKWVFSRPEKPVTMLSPRLELCLAFNLHLLLILPNRSPRSIAHYILISLSPFLSLVPFCGL